VVKQLLPATSPSTLARRTPSTWRFWPAYCELLAARRVISVACSRLLLVHHILNCCNSCCQRIVAREVRPAVLRELDDIRGGSILDPSFVRTGQRIAFRCAPIRSLCRLRINLTKGWIYSILTPNLFFQIEACLRFIKNRHTS
jgi:hypothetical protein